MFVGPGHRELVEQIMATHSFLKKIISFGDEFDWFVRRFQGASAKEFACEAQPTDENVALLMCSSGTTGLPKGVQLTQKNVMIGVEQHL